MESPPLEVIPGLIEARYPVYNQFVFQILSPDMIVEKTVYRSPGGVLIAGLVSKEDTMPVVDFRSTPDPTGLELVASLKDNWPPSLVLAQEAVSQLHAKQVKAIMSGHYRPLPVAQKDRNANPDNWNHAIVQWYKQDLSAVDYRQPGLESVDAVLEVAVGNYRIFNVQVSLRVLVKLIDPNTRRVIGRITESTYSVEDSPEILLNQQAEKFKQLAARMGAQLINQDLNELGLPLNEHILPAGQEEI
ncbi:MAG: hypothetical protein ACXV9T_15720 [Methylobacter sp.]